MLSERTEGLCASLEKKQTHATSEQFGLNPLPSGNGLHSTFAQGGGVHSTCYRDSEISLGWRAWTSRCTPPSPQNKPYHTAGASPLQPAPTRNLSRVHIKIQI